MKKIHVEHPPEILDTAIDIMNRANENNAACRGMMFGLIFLGLFLFVICLAIYVQLF